MRGQATEVCVCLNQVEVSISYRPGHFMQSLFRQLLIFIILDQSISSNAVEATSCITREFLCRATRMQTGMLMAVVGISDTL